MEILELLSVQARHGEVLGPCTDALIMGYVEPAGNPLLSDTVSKLTGEHRTSLLKFAESSVSVSAVAFLPRHLLEAADDVCNMLEVPRGVTLARRLCARPWRVVWMAQGLLRTL